MLKDIVGFSEHQEKATYGSGYNLTVTRIENDAALHKVVAMDDDRIKKGHIHWYVPPYTPSIHQQGELSKQFLNRTF